MRSNLIRAFALWSSFSSVLVSAQEQPRQTQAQRGREFLGLGPVPDAAAAARGEKLYAQSCSFCHGPKAAGAEGPNLVRSTVVLHDEKGETVGQVLRNGRPDRGMPAFPAFTPEQIYDVSEFLHARVEAATNRFEYKVGNVVTGDARAGEKFFKGEGGCQACHSVTGDLAHIAARYEPADLQAQFLYPTTAPPETVTVTLPSGETVRGKVKKIDDFNVSLWDEEGNYRSWLRSAVTVKIEDPLGAHRKLLDRYDNRTMHDVLAFLETFK